MNNTNSFSFHNSAPCQLLTPVSFIAGFLLYVFVCSALRFKGRNALLKKYYFPTRESLSKMTVEDAQGISQYLGELEFPWIYMLSHQFALLMTYGVPTISSILVKTKQLSTPKYSSKRYADTIVMVDEIRGHPPDNERVIKSLARINYHHGRYPEILNSDFLFTLGVIIREPIDWINKYEWRSLTPTEICAMALFWKDVGDKMNINYDELEGFEKGWKDGIEFYDDIIKWTERYERKNMVPAQTNKQTGDETISVFLCHVPFKLKPYGKKALSVLMGQRLRNAMLYDAPSLFYETLIPNILLARRQLLRYLSPPRPGFLRVRALEDAPNPDTGRYHYKNYQAHPFYVEPTFWSRWGSDALLIRLLGGIVPDQHADIYSPQGYLFSDIGPARTKGKGLDKTDQFERKIRSAAQKTRGCPFIR